MATSLLNKPGVLTWTRNPFYYQWIFTLPATNSRLQVQVINVTTSQVVTEMNYPMILPTGSALGNIKVYAHSLLEPLTKYARPTFLTPGAAAQTCEMMVGNIVPYKLQWRVISPGVSPSYTVESIYNLIRGGIGDMTFVDEETVNKYTGPTTTDFLPNKAGWLTWVPDGRALHPDEWGWISWLNWEGSPQSVDYVMNYTDGTTSTINRPLQNGSSIYKTWYIPTGILQAGLDPLNKGVQSYSVNIRVLSSYMATYNFRVDARPVYNPLTIYYRNSVGGWDHITVTGEHDTSADLERKEYDQARPIAVNGANGYYASSVRPKWRGVTGYLTAQHCAALIDLLMSTECAILYSGKWLPVRMTTKTIKYFDTRDNLHSVPLEFEAAGSFTSFPKQLVNIR